MGAREALVKDRERHMEEADNMGIKLFKVEDTLDHAHVTENRSTVSSNVTKPLRHYLKLLRSGSAGDCLDMFGELGTVMLEPDSSGQYTLFASASCVVLGEHWYCCELLDPAGQ